MQITCGNGHTLDDSTCGLCAAQRIHSQELTRTEADVVIYTMECAVRDWTITLDREGWDAMPVMADQVTRVLGVIARIKLGRNL